MEVDIVTLVVSNIPNFVGFAVLAYIQWLVYEKLVSVLDKCLEKLE